jgi:hypothetical protein
MSVKNLHERPSHFGRGPLVAISHFFHELLPRAGAFLYPDKRARQIRASGHPNWRESEIVLLDREFMIATWSLPGFHSRALV